MTAADIKLFFSTPLMDVEKALWVRTIAFTLKLGMSLAVSPYLECSLERRRLKVRSGCLSVYVRIDSEGCCPYITRFSSPSHQTYVSAIFPKGKKSLPKLREKLLHLNIFTPTGRSQHHRESAIKTGISIFYPTCR